MRQELLIALCVIGGLGALTVLAGSTVAVMMLRKGHQDAGAVMVGVFIFTFLLCVVLSLTAYEYSEPQLAQSENVGEKSE